MINNLIFKEIFEKAEKIFKAPSITYDYNNIILGCNVYHEGKREKMYAVASNTWRGFHKIDKNNEGAGVIFNNYFIRNRELIIERLKSISTTKQLDDFEASICREIKSRLINIKSSMLQSYNKIRKPVDLYIEHIAAMAPELQGYREQQVKLLFLPLDSQIFHSSYIFSLNELHKYGLTRSCSFSSVDTKQKYDGLQSLLTSKATTIKNSYEIEYERIYFDLIWNDRYTKIGNNLFQLNF